MPAAITGTERIPALAPLRVAHGEPIPLDDLRDLGLKDAAAEATDRPTRRDRAPGGDAVNPARPLLIVDGDSLAHRAFHALPSSIKDGAGRPANMIVGFGNMLVTVWRRSSRGDRRRLRHAHVADLPAHGLRGVPVRPRVPPS